jgi:hypothetical protein
MVVSGHQEPQNIQKPAFGPVRDFADVYAIRRRMPDYLVLITLSGKNESDVREQVHAAFGAAVAEEVSIALSTGSSNYYQACEANDHFGCVHWTDEDLFTKLTELEIEPTPKIIEDVKSSHALRHIADRMIEQGWYSIEQAIAEAQVE